VSTRCYAVVAGGGTAGHVVPALAVARALVARGHRQDEIELVGSRRGPDAELFGAAGFAVTSFPGRGLRRSFAPADLWANLGAVAGLASASAQAVAALRRWRPSVVVSVGGYASFPAGAAAVALRRPLVLVNVDAVPGLVHRVLGRFAAASAVAFGGTDLPRAVVTGTPLGDELAALAGGRDGVAEARAALGLPVDRATVAVVGGSLGSARINRAVLGMARSWSARADVAVYHVTGRRDHGWVTAEAPAPVDGGLVYRIVDFEHAMAKLYRAADVVVSRAGAMTVAELAVAGVPAVLVPLPGAPSDHQRANATALESGGAAVVLDDDACTPARVAEVVGALLADPARRAEMADAARRLGHPDAAARVAEVVEDAAGGRPRPEPDPVAPGAR